MTFKGFAMTALSAATAASPVAVGAADATGQAGSREMGKIVVTATRTERTQSATLAPNTVITRADIERTQAESVRELLRRSPGISVANQGGPGKLTSIFVRGTNSNHTLLLVDGVRYDDITSGVAAIQDIPVEQIERIEIVRGPRSSLYGADAIGGVIQIFTRDGEGRAEAPYFSVGGGTHGTQEGQAGFSGGNRRGHYNLSVSGTETDGFNACRGRPFGAPGGGAGCFVDQPDNDGYERTSGSLNAGYRFDNGLNMRMHVLRSEGDVEFDGGSAAGNRADILRQILGVSAGANIAERWQLELSVGRSTSETDNFFNRQPVNAIDSEIDTVRLQNDVTLTRQDRLTVGMDYRVEQVEGTIDYFRTERDNAGAFVQYLGTRGDHQLQLALRGDDNEQFGGHTTGSVTWGWQLTSAHTLSASFGTAFSAPTFDDLFFPAAFGMRPSNPDLEPEQSESAELGLTSHRDWGRWSLRAYETRVDELIILDSAFVPQNLSEARLRGVEADVGMNLGQWVLNGQASFVDAKNRGGGANNGNELARRPEYSGQLDVDRRFGRYVAGLGLFVSGPSFDDQANTRKLDGYELLELRGEMTVVSDWRLQARVSNLLDEDYETVGLFNQPGRTYFVTLRYQP